MRRVPSIAIHGRPYITARLLKDVIQNDHLSSGAEIAAIQQEKGRLFRLDRNSRIVHSFPRYSLSHEMSWPASPKLLPFIRRQGFTHSVLLVNSFSHGHIRPVMGILAYLMPLCCTSGIFLLTWLIPFMSPLSFVRPFHFSLTAIHLL